MSALCGIWQFDGEPVEPETIERMMNALADRGLNGSGIWRADAVAFGHQMLHITPESLYEVLPWQDGDTGLVITADARLDNRGTLCDELGILHPERPSLADSVLVLRAFERWGEKCIEHLLGAFAFVIWDARRQCLVCATDAIGERGLYYFAGSRRFIFASEIRGILAAPDVPKLINERSLASLALPLFDPNDRESTFYKNIQRMDAGCVLIVTPANIQKTIYWQPDPTRRLSYKTDTEILEALRELLFDAVRVRLRTPFPVAALLSGGLDSSSLTAIAARILGESGKRLTTFSAVVPDEWRSRYTDERGFIDAFQSWDNIDRVWITAQGRGPFDDPQRQVADAEGPAITSRHYLYSAFASAARERGVRIVLDGCGGEYGPSTGGAGVMLEWFMTGAWNRLWREARARAMMEHRPVWKILEGAIARPLVPNVLLRLLGRDPLGKWANLWNLSPLRADFLHRVLGAEVDRLQAQVASFEHIEPDHRVNMARIHTLVRGGFTFKHPIGGEPVYLAMPFADRRLFEFCLAAPGHLKLHNGYARYLIRASMEGVLPTAIQWRTTKEPFSPDFPSRYNHQQPAIKTWLQTIAPDDPVRSVVDVPKLQTMVDHSMDITDNRGSAAENAAAMHYVPLGIFAIYFLRQFDAFRY